MEKSDINIRSITRNLKWLLHNGLLHVVGSGVFNRIISFVGSVVVIRFISKETYGYFTYVDNIMSFFILTDGLGIKSGILQYCSEDIDDDVKKSYYRFGLKFGSIYNLFLCLAFFLVSVFAPLSLPQAKKYMIFFSLFPAAYFFPQYFEYIFRAKRDNKRYAYITTIYTVLYAAGEVVLTWKFGLKGIFEALYLTNIISAVIAIVWLGKSTFESQHRLTNSEQKELIKYSLYSCLNTSLSNLLITLDVFLLGIIVADSEALASYKVGTNIPMVMVTIPTTIIMFVYPYFAQHHHDSDWFNRNLKKLFGYLIPFNLVISVLLFLFAPQIITLIYGTKYSSSISVFKILSIYYFVAGTFRIPAANLLATIRQVDITLKINIVSGVFNVLLDVLFIQHLGIIGAAWATLSVSIVSSVMLVTALIKNTKKMA